MRKIHFDDAKLILFLQIGKAPAFYLKKKYIRTEQTYFDSPRMVCHVFGYLISFNTPFTGSSPFICGVIVVEPTTYAIIPLDDGTRCTQDLIAFLGY